MSSGNATLVQYLVDKGLPTKRTDLRGNLPVDIAVDNNFKDIITILQPEEEGTEDFQITKKYFEDHFKDLKNEEK